MAWLGTRTYLAVDASTVTAALVAQGVAGGRLASLVQERLPAGAVTPGPAGRNVADREAVRAAIARALGGARSGRVTLVLPDGVARLALVEPAAGVPPADYVRYRLASSLPWPASDGSFDVLDAGQGRVVGAAVRRATVGEYEGAVGEAGGKVERVHLAPLLALAGLRRERRAGAVHALLGDVAMCLALVQDGSILALRSRRRDRSPGEVSRLRAELLRLASSAANGNGRLPLTVSGSNASALRPALEADAAGAAVAAEPVRAEAGEACWLLGLAG